MDDWPTLSSELSRKALEVLDKWMKKYDAGKISRREFYILISGLYDTVSGIAHEDVRNILTEIEKDLRTKSS